MTLLEIFKDVLRLLGVSFLEKTTSEHTYIVTVNENDIEREVSLTKDRFWEFDEDGDLASYP